MCCELQQGVQLLTLCMADQEELQASISLISQQVQELEASRSKADEAIASQLRDFQTVLEATAASTVAEVTSALTALTDARSCTELSDDDLQRLSHACLVPLKEQNRALFNQMTKAADLVVEIEATRNLQDKTWRYLQEMPNMRFPGIDIAMRAELDRFISIIMHHQPVSTVSAQSVVDCFETVRILSLFQALLFLEPIVFFQDCAYQKDKRGMLTAKTEHCCLHQ